MANHVITCLLCWPSDPGWITAKPGFIDEGEVV